MEKNNVAICVPVWGRHNETKICLESMFKHTDMSFIHSINVYDNNSHDDRIEDMVKSFDVNYIKGDFPSAWHGMFKMSEDLREDGSCHYLAKVDNDVEFTVDWIKPILDVFESDEKIASVRYGRSESNGNVDLSLKDGYSGGLKVFRKHLFDPGQFSGKGAQRFFGSEGLSRHLQKKGLKTVSIEAGLKMQSVPRSNGK
jgi:hypothetical protein